MSKKILTIVLIALGVAGIVAALWWWFFTQQPVAPATSGTFGSGETKSTGNAEESATPQTNIGTPLLPTAVGANTVAGGQGGINQAGSGGYAGLIGGAPQAGQAGVPDVVWVSDTTVTIDTQTNQSQSSQTTSGSSAGSPGTVFNPLPVTDIHVPTPSQGVSISLGSGGGGGGNNGGTGLGGALLGAGAAGAVKCALPQLAGAIGGSFALAAAGLLFTDNSHTSVGIPTYDAGVQNGTLGTGIITSGTTVATNLSLAIDISNLIRSEFLDCVARAIAHAALEQIAASTVNWINSGFNGSPSFVQNPTQFFTNVADAAAGEYIKGSQLAFLCSPFQLQIRIAIAQSYASSRKAQACTLTKAVNNIQNFMNGDFSSGGWGGFLSFIGSPSNNPYGAYAYATVGLNSALSSAVGQQQNDLLLGGGFLSIRQEKNCKTYGPEDGPLPSGPDKKATDLGDGVYKVCDMVTTTPGKVVASAMDQTLGINTQSLETAKYFDEIIGALVSQLMQNIAYSGLSNLSGGNGGSGYGYNAGDINFSNNYRESILQNIPPLKASAQHLIDLLTQNVSNIDAALERAQTLRSCWIQKSTSPDLSTQRQTQAQANASSTDAVITDLNNRRDFYSGRMATAKTSITVLESYQAKADAATDSNALGALISNFTIAVQNKSFIADTDVVDAQEDQLKLQSDLGTINGQIVNGISQCNAFN